MTIFITKKYNRHSITLLFLESVDTVAVDDGTVIDMYDDYKITSAGIHKIHKTGENWNSARNICLDEKGI